MQTIYTDEDGAADPELMTILRDWRYQEARQHDIPAFWIMSNRVMAELAIKRPRTLEELAEIHGMGRARMEKYGATLLDVLNAARGELDAKPIEEIEAARPYGSIYRVAGERQQAVLQAAGILSPAEDVERLEVMVTCKTPSKR